MFLHETVRWDFWQVGGYLASWIIIYGFIQAVAPKLTGRDQTPQAVKAQLVMFGGLLTLIPAGIAIALTRDFPIVYVVTFGLLLFALLFATNSALHSYLIVRFARADGASLDIGFYYMANAGGRLWNHCIWGSVSMDWVGGLLMDIGSFHRVRVNHSAVGTRRRRRRRVADTYSFFNASPQ